MFNKSLENVGKVNKLDLCVSCGICSSVCPTGCISMEFSKGQFLPEIDDNKCNNCGLCLSICPGFDIYPPELENKRTLQEYSFGKSMDSYIVYSNDPFVRKNSASGGIVTSLIVNLIKDKEYDYAFVLNFKKFTGEPAKVKITNDINEIVNAARSKYIPASVSNIIETLKKDRKGKFIIVGTPCQISGIKKFINKFKIPESNLLFLGLFCEKTMNYNVIKYYEDKYKRANEKIETFYFKTKEKNGWPGDSKIVFDSGRELLINKKVRMKMKQYFQLNRCLYCLDKFNQSADISFGDCYIKGYEDFYGKSNVIIRTEEGKANIDKYLLSFSSQKVDVKEIYDSQDLKSINENYNNLVDLKNRISPGIKKNKISFKQRIKLWKVKINIKIGQEYKFTKIELVLVISKIKDRVSAKINWILNRANKNISVICFYIYTIIVFEFKNKKNIINKKHADNIIIVGGELFNKGAQAMTFTVVDQMYRRFPDKRIYLFSDIDYGRPESEKNIYNFEILPWNEEIRKIILGLTIKQLFRKKGKDTLIKIKDVIKNTSFIIDISGYALSSQWGVDSSINYLYNIAIARKYSIPYFIFPQSIGPFDYEGQKKAIIFSLLKCYLGYPEKVFVREKEGEISVKHFSTSNVYYTTDIVLHNKDYNLDNIYRKKPDFKLMDILPHSVGIIPNQRVFEKNTQNDLLRIYKGIIDTLCELNMNVYLVRHSFEDLSLCYLIKTMFGQNSNVKLLTCDLNAIEFEYLTKQFEFIIASRYHSIIHAYKKGVPAIVIGWATKYHELLENYDQLEYFYDCRNIIQDDKIKQSVNKMGEEHNRESLKILNILNNISNTNSLFDSINERNIENDRR